MDKLPKGWTVKTIKEICIIRPPKSEVKDLKKLEVSFIPMATVKEHQIDFKTDETKLLEEVYSGYTFFKENDVLLAKVTPCFENGKSAIARNLINGIGFGSSEFYVLRSKDGILPEWIYRIVSSQDFINKGRLNMSGAVGLKRVTPDFLYNYEIPLPPLTEQTRIVSKLDALFARIDKSIALLEENIKHTKGLMASVLEEVFEKLKTESTIYKIKEIAEIKGGKRLPKGESIQDEKTDYPYIRVTDFTDDGTIDVNSVKYMNKSVQEQIKRYIITSKDLYISIAGTIGKTGIIPKELENANLTENAARLVFKLTIKINNRFIYYFTLSDNFKDQVGLATKTVAQPKLALQRLAEVELPIPSIEVQNKEVQIFDELSRKFQEINKEQQSKLTYLKALKSSLLDRAFKGDL